MKIRCFYIFLFALTANLAIANCHSIINIIIDKSGTSDKDSIAIDNPFFKVVRDGALFSLSNTSNIGTRIIAALDIIKFKSSRGVINIKRGEIAVFKENEFYEVPKGSYFEIALKKNHPDLAKPSEWVEPTKNIVVYEDNEFRVFEEHLNPGDTRELHSHAQRVVVRLNDVQLTDPRIHPNGKPGTGMQVANTVKYAEPMVHVTKNLSKKPLFNIVIEYKIKW